MSGNVTYYLLLRKLAHLIKKFAYGIIVNLHYCLEIHSKPTSPSTPYATRIIRALVKHNGSNLRKKCYFRYIILPWRSFKLIYPNNSMHILCRVGY